ncbi:MAG: hypothetical protein V1754_15415 [Pseudomonadota bacterium]
MRGIISGRLCYRRLVVEPFRHCRIGTTPDFWPLPSPFTPRPVSWPTVNELSTWVLPAVAQCLHPDVMRKAPERCRLWMELEDEQSASAMNRTLRLCLPKPDDGLQ